MLLGVMYGILACALWGFIYLVPVLLPAYDPVSIAMARFAAFGAASFLLVFRFRREFLSLSGRDWLLAFCYSFFGNAVYYVFLSQGIRLAGIPPSGMLMALIPLNVALLTNRKSADPAAYVSWKKLGPALFLTVLGLWIGNVDEFSLVASERSSADFLIGVLLSGTAMALWTWFPIRNAQWLLRHPQTSAIAWTTAQGVSIFPVTVLCYLAAVLWEGRGAEQEMSFFGPEPMLFISVILAAGIICGWGGMALWNLMSERLPVSLSGQMIVFETIFSIIYALIYRREWPSPLLVAGLTILLIGITLSLKCFRDAIEKARNKKDRLSEEKDRSF